MAIHGRITLGLALATALSFSTAAMANEPEAVPGEFVVKLKANVRKSNLTSLSHALGAQIKSAIVDDNIVVVKRPVIETSKSVIKTLQQNPLVEIAEPNYIYRAVKMPNDPSFGKLWGLRNFGQNDARGAGTSGIDIDAVRAWDITQGSEDTVIAVIDTGVDYNHPDLKENMWVNEAEANGKPGTDDDGNGYVDDVYGYNFVDAEHPTADPKDDHGHGSHCSGTIGGRGDDGKGIVGVNWRVKIMAIKFLGGDGGGTLEGAIRGIDYATKMGAKIMSNSWGGGGESQTLKEAIQRANQAGALFVAAAGNDSANNDTNPHYPSSYNVPNVLSVAAIDNNAQLASFSNYGKKSTHVAAPGVNIYSSVKDGKYDSWSGTSMATPHVSGVAGLLASKEPTLTHLQLKQRIVSTIKPLSSMRNKVSSGGMVNAYFALTNQVAPPDMNDPGTWASKSLSISSPHPYVKKSNETYEVKVDGAKEIALYFTKFDTEKGYDKLTLLDKAGVKIGEISGNNDDSYSATISGDYVKLVFTSDDSVEKYGFDISKVSYR